jgi:hypothetical protein
VFQVDSPAMNARRGAMVHRASVPDVAAEMPQDNWLDGPLSRFDETSRRYLRRKMRILGIVGGANVVVEGVNVPVVDENAMVEEADEDVVLQKNKTKRARERARQVLDALPRRGNIPIGSAFYDEPSRSKKTRHRKSVAPIRARSTKHRAEAPATYERGDRVIASWGNVQRMQTRVVVDDDDGDGDDMERDVGLAERNVDVRVVSLPNVHAVTATMSVQDCRRLDCSSLPNDVFLRQVLSAIQHCDDILSRPWIAWHALRQWWVNEPPPQSLILAVLDKMMQAFKRDSDTCTCDPSSLCVWVELYQSLGRYCFWKELFARCASDTELAWHMFVQLQCLASLHPLTNDGCPEYEVGDTRECTDWVSVDALIALESNLSNSRRTELLYRCVSLATLWKNVPYAYIINIMPASSSCMFIPTFVLCCEQGLPWKPDERDEWSLWLKLLHTHLADDVGGTREVPSEILQRRDYHQQNACIAVCVIMAGHDPALVNGLVEGCSLLGLACVANAYMWNHREFSGTLTRAVHMQARTLCNIATPTKEFNAGAIDALRWWRVVVSHKYAPPSLARLVSPMIVLFLDACRPDRLSTQVLRATCGLICECARCLSCGLDLFSGLMNALALVGAFEWDASHYEEVLSCVIAAAGDVCAHACGREALSRATLLSFLEESIRDRKRAFALSVAVRSLRVLRERNNNVEICEVEVRAWALAQGRYKSFSVSWNHNLSSEWSHLLFGTSAFRPSLEALARLNNGSLLCVALRHLASPATLAPVSAVGEAITVLGVAIHAHATQDVQRRWAESGLPEALHTMDCSRYTDEAQVVEVCKWILPLCGVFSKIYDCTRDEWARSAGATIFVGALCVLFRFKGAAKASVADATVNFLSHSSPPLLSHLVCAVLAPNLCAGVPSVSNNGSNNNNNNNQNKMQINKSNITGSKKGDDSIKRYWALQISTIDLCAHVLMKRRAHANVICQAASHCISMTRRLSHPVGARVRIKMLKLVPLMEDVVLKVNWACCRLLLIVIYADVLIDTTD